MFINHDRPHEHRFMQDVVPAYGIAYILLSSELSRRLCCKGNILVSTYGSHIQNQIYTHAMVAFHVPQTLQLPPRLWRLPRLEGQSTTISDNRSRSPGRFVLTLGYPAVKLLHCYRQSQAWKFARHATRTASSTSSTKSLSRLRKVSHQEGQGKLVAIISPHASPATEGHCSFQYLLARPTDCCGGDRIDPIRWQASMAPCRGLPALRWLWARRWSVDMIIRF